MLNYIKLILALIVLMNSVIECNASMQKVIDREKILKILKEAYERDQAPRKIIDSLYRSGCTDGNQFLPAFAQQREADSINAKVVFPIVDTLYKYKIYDWDSIAYRHCWCIIQHADDEVMIKYTDFVEQLAKRDLISTSSYMAYSDRLQIDKGRAQLYGYQHHRTANGTMIQYPVLTGIEKRWEELGSEYETNNILPSDYTIDYKAVEITEDQFVCIGFIFEGESDYPIEKLSPVVNADVILDKNVITTTDSNGYFCVVINKKKIPSNIELIINNTPVEYKIEQNADKNFLISTGYFNNGKIDVESK
jgi:hypothetical protein